MTARALSFVRGPLGVPDREQEVIETGTEMALKHSNGLGLSIAYWTITTSGGTIRLPRIRHEVRSSLFASTKSPARSRIFFPDMGITQSVVVASER